MVAFFYAIADSHLLVSNTALFSIMKTPIFCLFFDRRGGARIGGGGLKVIFLVVIIRYVKNFTLKPPGLIQDFFLVLFLPEMILMIFTYEDGQLDKPKKRHFANEKMKSTWFFKRHFRRQKRHL